MVNLKVGDFAIVPKECNEYLTPNKEYKIITVFETGSFQIISDNNDLTYCLQTECGHINCKDWSFKTKSN